MIKAEMSDGNKHSGQERKPNGLPRAWTDCPWTWGGGVVLLLFIMDALKLKFGIRHTSWCSD